MLNTKIYKIPAFFFIVVNNKNFVILDIVRTMVLWGLVDFYSMN